MDDNKNLKMRINNFIKDKETEAILKYEIKNLQRKIEIAKGIRSSSNVHNIEKENYQ